MSKKGNIRQQFSDKFQDYEATPQEDSWEKIRFALDLKEKFNDYEAEPQDESWEKISLATNLSEKFKNFEAQPQDNSWEKISLATNLTEKFRQYEAEPQAKSWEIIKAAIQKEKRRPVIFLPIFYRAGIAASIAILLGFGWFLSRNTEKNTPNVVSSNIPDKLNKTTTKKVNPANNLPETQTLVAKTDKVLPESNDKNNSISEENLAKNTISEKRKPILIQNQSKGRNNILGGLQKKEFFAKNKDKIDKQKEKNNIPINIENNKIKEENIIAANKIIEISQPESNDKTLTISPLSSKSFREKLIKKPFDAIAYNNERPMMEQEERVVRRKMILTTSLMPLQAYQALTILPQTNSYIQQVGTLNALDAQRLGIQFRVGAMKPLSNRFSTGASLAYSGIQQRVSYEVNNGNYEIQTIDSQTYSLVSLGENVNQSKFLQTVGVKIDNSFLIAKKKNEVYVLGGGEAVRVLNDKEYAYFLNASVGVSYPTKNGKSIWIEPTFRYSLSQSFDANNYLQIRPYNIGLNVRVNFM